MNCSSVSPCHGLQLFTNCLSMGSSHGVQSFRNRLLQRGSPTGSQALPANLLQRGLLSPWVRRSCQEPAPVRAPHGVTASFRHPPALVWGPFHRLQVEICSTMDLHGLQGAACLTMVCCTGCRRTSALSAGACPHPPSSLTLVSAAFFLSHIVTPLQLLLCSISACPPPA